MIFTTILGGAAAAGGGVLATLFAKSGGAGIQKKDKVGIAFWAATFGAMGAGVGAGIDWAAGNFDDETAQVITVDEQELAAQKVNTAELKV